MNSKVNTENRRILLVDDTREIHDDFRKILCPVAQNSDLDALEADLFGDDEGGDESSSSQTLFELSSAYQGEEALELVRKAREEKKPFAMAFVDVRMPPGWNGIDTLVRLWEVDPQLQAVICTAYSDYSWEETFQKLGRSDRLLVLKKPFDPVEVEQLANALTSKWSLGLKARLTMGSLKRMVDQRTATIEQQKTLLEQKLQELEDTRMQLIQAEKLASVGQLAAGVAHEINNPIGFMRSNLSSMEGYVENLQPLLTPLLSPPDATEQRAELLSQLASQAEQSQLEYLLEDMSDVLQETLDGVDRISKIVADLHGFSHVNDESVSSIKLNNSLEKALRILARQMNGIELRKQLGEIPEFVADGARLSDTLLSLLQNAIDALQSTETPTLSITTKATDNGLSLSITDNGAGIDTETLPRIFDPFFTTKDVGEGTGLSLHTAQTLINELGGTIQASSKPGVGTRIMVNLPAS